MVGDVEAASTTLDASPQLYLDLMKKCLCRYFPDSCEPIEPYVKGGMRSRYRAAYWILTRILSRWGLELARPVNLALREEGRDWPFVGETMIGLRRLNNLQYCITDVINRRVQGDFIEAGVWRGGAVIFMRAALEAFGDTKRNVWVADSFRGLPKPDLDKYPADKIFDYSSPAPQPDSSLESVKKNFEWYKMLDDRVIFLPGLFRDTLPRAPIEQLALIRLDGDLYESTMDGLKSLYPKLSTGGYVIIDDYNCYRTAKQATDDFRKEYGITDELVRVDWTAVYWKRGSKREEGP